MFRVPAVAGPVLEHLGQGHTYAPVRDRRAARALGRFADQTGRLVLARTRQGHTLAVPTVRTPTPCVVRKDKRTWAFKW